VIDAPGAETSTISCAEIGARSAEVRTPGGAEVEPSSPAGRLAPLSPSPYSPLPYSPLPEPAADGEVDATSALPTDAGSGGGGGGGGNGACGGGGIGWSGGCWDDRSRAVFSKLEREFRGRPKQLLLTRVALELPHVSADDVENRLGWMGRHRRYRERVRGLGLAWEKRREALVSSARQMLSEQAVAEGRVQLKREQADALASRRHRLRAELAVLATARDAREREEMKVGRSPSRISRADTARQQSSHAFATHSIPCGTGAR